MQGCGAKELFYVLCYQDFSPLFFQLSKKVVDPGGRLLIGLKVPLLGSFYQVGVQFPWHPLFVLQFHNMLLR